MRPPFFCIIKFTSRSGFPVRIILPLLLFWLLLLPIAVLKLVIFLLADFFLYILRRNFRLMPLFSAFYGLLCSLNGLKINVAKKRKCGAIEISIQ